MLWRHVAKRAWDSRGSTPVSCSAPSARSPASRSRSSTRPSSMVSRARRAGSTIAARSCDVVNGATVNCPERTAATRAGWASMERDEDRMPSVAYASVLDVSLDDLPPPEPRADLTAALRPARRRVANAVTAALEELRPASDRFAVSIDAPYRSELTRAQARLRESTTLTAADASRRLGVPIAESELAGWVSAWSVTARPMARSDRGQDSRPPGGGDSPEACRPTAAPIVPGVRKRHRRPTVAHAVSPHRDSACGHKVVDAGDGGSRRRR